MKCGGLNEVRRPSDLTDSFVTWVTEEAEENPATEELVRVRPNRGSDAAGLSCWI